jgi:hypothetical protein
MDGTNGGREDRARVGRLGDIGAFEYLLRSHSRLDTFSILIFERQKRLYHAGLPLFSRALWSGYALATHVKDGDGLDRRGLASFLVGALQSKVTLNLIVTFR